MKKLSIRVLVLAVMSLILLVPAYGGTDEAGRQRRASEYVNRGYGHMQTGQYDKSAEVFRQALRMAPDTADAYAGLGISYFKLGCMEGVTLPATVQKAVEALTKAISLGADSPDVRLALGLSYLALDNIDAALEQYEVLSSMDGPMADVLLARIRQYSPPERFIIEDETDKPKEEAEPDSGGSGKDDSGGPADAAAPVDWAGLADACNKKADQLVKPPSDTALMSNGAKEEAEREYARQRSEQINKCMDAKVSPSGNEPSEDAGDDSGGIYFSSIGFNIPENVADAGNPDEEGAADPDSGAGKDDSGDAAASP